MGKFKYSESEKEINKVLKMNQDQSMSLLNDPEMKDIRKDADTNIAASLELLRSLGKGKQVDQLVKSVQENGEKRNYKLNPKVQSWEELVKEADVYCPDVVELEDIMTEEEIEASFAERDEIYEAFSKKTSIVNKVDLSFLAVAIALQVAKALIYPYVAQKFHYGESFDPNSRLNHNDPSIEKRHREANDRFRDEHMGTHKAGYWVNMLYQTPPYDITTGSKDLGINMGGKAHRMYTLGHDPMLGWIFGTANIMTDCITFNSFTTNRVRRFDPVTHAKKMIITPEIVPTGLMFKECYDMTRADFLNLPAAIFAQAQHLKSDKFTKMGLPVPFLSSFNEKLAGELYRQHYDALCFSRDIKIIGASFFVSKLIDMIILLTHGLFRKENEDQKLYEVRTRKILLVSNSIASTSNIIQTCITKNPKHLDIGGLLNTVIHLFSDVRFIFKIKQEYVQSEISKRLDKEIAEIDYMYDNL